MWLYRDTLGPGDMPLLEKLLRESKTWALVDPLAVHSAGDLVERHPQLVRVLDDWAEDQDFWIRRSALARSTSIHRATPPFIVIARG